MAQFEAHTGRQTQNFVAYLERHRHRIVNYDTCRPSRLPR